VTGVEGEERRVCLVSLDLEGTEICAKAILLSKLNIEPGIDLKWITVDSGLFSFLALVPF
jgi:hypothetical protein